MFNDDQKVVQTLLDANADPYVFSVTNVLPIDIAGVLEDYQVVNQFLDVLKDKAIVILEKTEEDR